MLTFEFYTPDEKLPKDGEEIVYLSKQSSFSTEYFEVRVGKIEEEIWEDNTSHLLVLHSYGADYFDDEVKYWNYPFDIEED
ncbi:MAG: hypothetical protein EOM23_02550 [Candidatus Moranbacteria bacterium]|nr:hypothetical protein [Candidatus Moranbacteria bacterium]